MATINSLNTNMSIGAKSEILRPVQPAFLAYAGNTANVTGDGTVFTCNFDTEVFDNGSNFATGSYTFTAPVTGHYLLSFAAWIAEIGSSHTSGNLTIVTTESSYSKFFSPWGLQSNTDIRIGLTVFCHMTASDTAYYTITCSGGGKSIDFYGALAQSRFDGYLVC